MKRTSNFYVDNWRNIVWGIGIFNRPDDKRNVAEGMVGDAYVLETTKKDLERSLNRIWWAIEDSNLLPLPRQGSTLAK